MSEILKHRFCSEYLSLSECGESVAGEIGDIAQIKDIFPKDFNISANPDVLPIVAPLAVVGRFNRNGVGIDIDGAKQLQQKLKWKLVDYEHDRSKVIGVSMAVGFSDLDNNEMLEECGEECFLNVAGVLYRIVDDKLVEDIGNAGKPESMYYGSYSTSWEIVYTNYKIAIGSDVISEAEIIPERNKAEFKKHLKVFGGTGSRPDGTMVRQILSGELSPVGWGIVKKPAAYVRGLYNLENEESIAINQSSARKIFDNFAKTSQIENNNVNLNRTAMDAKVVELLEQIAKVLEKGDGGESVASLQKAINEKIKEASEKWVTERKNLEEAAQKAEDEKKALDEKLSKLETEAKEAQDKIESLESQISAANSDQLLSSRMAEIDNSYELDDELRKIVMEDLKTLDESDDSFASYKRKTSAMLKGKEKKEGKDKEESAASLIEDKAKEGKISFEDLKEALAAAELEITDIPNASEPPTDLKNRWAKAFNKESIKITNR